MRNAFSNAFGASGGGADATKLPLAGGTLTGQLIQSTNGAASTPPLLLNGTIFTGGTGTTNLPNFLIQPTGATAATSWNTSGTAIGVNLDVSAGRFLDMRVDGVEKLYVNNDGSITINGSVIASTGYVRAGNIYLNSVTNVAEFYHDSCAILIGAGVSTADLRRGGAYCLQLGTDAAPVSNQHFKACNRITSDGVGANLTLSGGNGRGGAGGDLILASYTTAGSGVAGTLTTRWKLDAATGELLPGANATYSLGNSGAVLANVFSTDYYSGSTKVVGAQGAAVADASGGAVVDAEARTAINDLLARVRAHGLIAT